MNPNDSDFRLVIFVKAPRPGFVKTRLAATIGAEAAAESYAALAEHLLTRLGSLREVELKFTPPEAAEEIQPWLQAGWTASAQSDGDLTKRLIGAFADAFAAGAGKVVVIGSDCPYVTPDDIAEAFAKLAEHELVLGPANDGGYWLVGLRQPRPALFQGIHWSTESVLAETLAIAELENLSVARLRELSDIDTIADLLCFNEWRQTSASS